MDPAKAGSPIAALRRLPPGVKVELTDSNGYVWTGSLVPPHALSGPTIVSLKLESGYNVGIAVDERTTFKEVDRPVPVRSPEPSSFAARAKAADDEWITLLTTGGTIASRVDYETGGVRPVHDAQEILAFYPELESSGSVRVVPVLDRLSENVGPADWLVLAQRVVEAFGSGAQGVVIAHGTDTLGFTAAGLSFLLAGLPGPVVLVGAQRSPDRPSSDGASNLEAAAAVARDRRLGEVVVVMHGGLSDDRFAVHRGTWVRKMHSSRRDAFESRNGPPLGTVEGGKVHLLPIVRPPGPGPARVDGPIDERAGLLWFYPGLTPERARGFSEGLRGIVIAGTGLGHVRSDLVDWVRSQVEAGVVVAMTTQCLEGGADPYVYATGRDLLRAGALYLDDLLPETAYAKLVWALGRATTPSDVRALMIQDRAGEFLRRHRPEAEA
jgi:glutamyl-tRNA(Gln) amidotransferase subunit D